MGVSNADASGEEGIGATIDFAVTLDAAPTSEATVGYATRDERSKTVWCRCSMTASVVVAATARFHGPSPASASRFAPCPSPRARACSMVAKETCALSASTADNGCPHHFVASREHPLQSARPSPNDLVRSPWLDWLDGYASARTGVW